MTRRLNVIIPEGIREVKASIQNFSASGFADSIIADVAIYMIGFSIMFLGTILTKWSPVLGFVLMALGVVTLFWLFDDTEVDPGSEDIEKGVTGPSLGWGQVYRLNRLGRPGSIDPPGPVDPPDPVQPPGPAPLPMVPVPVAPRPSAPVRFAAYSEPIPEPETLIEVESPKPEVVPFELAYSPLHRAMITSASSLVISSKSIMQR